MHLLGGWRVYKGPGRNFWKVGKNLSQTKKKKGKKNAWGGRGRGGSEELSQPPSNSRERSALLLQKEGAGWSVVQEEWG